MPEENSIRYPDALIGIWCMMHGHEQRYFSSEETCGAAMSSVMNMLAGHLYKNSFPGIRSKQDAADAAHDYFAELISGPCPAHITSSMYLITGVRKYLAIKNNPVGYELNSILHDALRALEKDRKIVRDEASAGKRISKRTRVALVGITGTALSERNDYEQHREQVHIYYSGRDSRDPEHSRMISPKDAQSLVLELLEAFGRNAWTAVPDLLAVMQNHIPEQLSVVSMDTPIGDDGDASFADLIPDDRGAEDVCRSDFSKRQAAMLTGSVAERIWQRICGITEGIKIFCLYSLPKRYGYKVKLEDIDGISSSTASDRDRKMLEILCDELKDYGNNSDAANGDAAILRFLQRNIIEKLTGNCRDKKLLGVEK